MTVIVGAGGACLRAVAGGLAVEAGGAVLLRCDEPVRVILTPGGEITAPYDAVELRSNRLECTATVRSGGASFLVDDVYDWGEPGLRLRRRVTVSGSGPDGFGSAVRWTPAPAVLPQWFLPGCVYGRNELAPSYAIGADLGERPVLVREDRLALPLAARYDPGTGTVVSLLHLSPSASTVADDDLGEEVISDRLGFGSFGDLSADEIGFSFPGREGTVSYPPMWTAGIGNSQADSPVNPFPRGVAAATGWTHRYHPVRDGASHRYELVLAVSSAGSFSEFVRSAWRSAWAVFRPVVRHADLAAVERASLSLLASSVVTDPAAAGIPTWIDVFTGRPGRLQDTFSIGFVGRNLEAGYVLLRAAERHGEPEWAKLGGELTDFWVRTAGSSGLCHTEWDRATGRWADDGVVYLRDQSEARTAVLASWSWLRSTGAERPDWLAWCTAYGDWLLGHTAADGSLHRRYRLDGTPDGDAVNDGIHAAAFLCRLADAVSDSRYLALAERIGGFYWERYHRDGIFAGGTLDNPNCYDREAASLAMEAYLALHAATGSSRWLEAARLAADFCASWIVGWDVLMDWFFDRSASCTGLALITLGFSAVDTYLARHTGDYLRLAAATGDDLYREIAWLMLHNTKQMVQLRHEYGYAAPGYQIEHWSIGRGRGAGLNSGWLPWVATSHVLSIWDACDLDHAR